MVNSVGFSNVSFGQVPQATANARQYMSAPYQNAAATDTVEIAGKKKTSTTTKVLIGTAITALAAVGTLYGLFKTGKLKKVENATKFIDKAQNLAYKGGEKLDKGVTKAIEWGKGLFDKVKSNKNTKTEA